MQGRQDDGRNGSGVLIDQRFLVLPDMPCGDFAGLPAFVAEPYQPADHAGRGRDRAPAPLIAVRTRRDAPPRANLPNFLNAYNISLLMPLAHGPGGADYWIC